ncbi:MAG TPA: penicillin-binding transpeptidase domain-containing protein [Verrucomicrobiae bacterium]|nr:penicillin-binding transpeptidase domain-containing protein [Verrucomicrobiae bacterium]
MLRRSALATLFAAPARWARAGAPRDLAPFFDGIHGAAVLLDAHTGRGIAAHAPDLAAGMPAPPGSTLKPFVLTALIEAGKLRPAEPWTCPGALTIAGRSFACSHPPVPAPLDVRTALAYSCNTYVAHFAARFGDGELALALARYGIEASLRPADTRLLALGEDGVQVTANGLAAAYRRLALRAARPVLAPILAGLEDAVEYGTAQRAAIPAVKVAGKTGSVVAPDGAHLAWFAGFAPSRAPSVILIVLVKGRSGGSDAAPVAGRILKEAL